VISISHDSNLRKSIQKLSIEEANICSIALVQLRCSRKFKSGWSSSRGWEQEEVLKEQTVVEQHLADDEIK
jgi:hypothetical protein